MKGNDHMIKKLLIFRKIYCQQLSKCIEISRENLHTDVRVLRVDRWEINISSCFEGMFLFEC